MKKKYTLIASNRKGLIKIYEEGNDFPFFSQRGVIELYKGKGDSFLVSVEHKSDDLIHLRKPVGIIHHLLSPFRRM